MNKNQLLVVKFLYVEQKDIQNLYIITYSEYIENLTTISIS